jgi:signal peptidase II
MPEAARRGWARWLLVSAVVLVLDRAAKIAIVSTFAPGEGHELLPFLKLVLVYNSGAAFSLLADASGWQRWFFTVVAVAISAGIVWMLRHGRNHWLASLALSLVLGGALGNLWDRLTVGRVVDFVVAHAGGHAFPAFNVADSAITIGVALLILDGLRARRSAPKGGRLEDR